MYALTWRTGFDWFPPVELRQVKRWRRSGYTAISCLGVVSKGKQSLIPKHFRLSVVLYDSRFGTYNLTNVIVFTFRDKTWTALTEETLLESPHLSLWRYVEVGLAGRVSRKTAVNIIHHIINELGSLSNVWDPWMSCREVSSWLRNLCAARADSRYHW